MENAKVAIEDVEEKAEGVKELDRKLTITVWQPCMAPHSYESNLANATAA